jgi:hypothetical protein
VVVSLGRRLFDWSGDVLGGTGDGLGANNICVGAWMLKLLTVTGFEIFLGCLGKSCTLLTRCDTSVPSDALWAGAGSIWLSHIQSPIYAIRSKLYSDSELLGVSE